MRRLDTCILLLTLCACSSTPKAAPEQAFDSELVAEAQAAALEGPDGWNYVGVSLDGDTPEFVLARDGRRFVIPGAGYERFVPTLGGNVFAVDEAGVWWHFFEGERLASMPWADMRATGAAEGDALASPSTGAGLDSVGGAAVGRGNDCGSFEVSGRSVDGAAARGTMPELINDSGGRVP